MSVKRNGFQTFLNMCHGFCTFFGTWRGPVTAAINNHPTASADDKARLIAAMAAIDAACVVVDALRTTWESK
ncbi:MAG: hypothetical protein ACRCWJ_23735 [Casimicrobium sp.]